MNRDELVEASALGDPLRKERNRRALLDLITEGATHILMKDGTAVPLDGGEAVEGVVVLRKVDPESIGDEEHVFVPGAFGHDGWSAWGVDVEAGTPVYVPLNTPSKPNQEDSAVVALSESKEHEES